MEWRTIDKVYNYKSVVENTAHYYHSSYYRHQHVTTCNKGYIPNQGQDGHVRNRNFLYDSQNPYGCNQSSYYGSQVR